MNDHFNEWEKQIQNLCDRISYLEDKQHEILDLLTKLVQFLETDEIKEKRKGVYHENGYDLERPDLPY